MESHHALVTLAERAVKEYVRNGQRLDLSIADPLTAQIDASRNERAGTFVEMHPQPKCRVLCKGHGERRRARAGAKANVMKPRKRKLVGKRAHIEPRAVFVREVHGAVNAASIGFILSADSAYSRAGSEPATMPQPAKMVAQFCLKSADRIATTNSPSKF